MITPSEVIPEIDAPAVKQPPRLPPIIEAVPEESPSDKPGEGVSTLLWPESVVPDPSTMT